MIFYLSLVVWTIVGYRVPNDSFGPVIDEAVSSIEQVQRRGVGVHMRAELPREDRPAKERRRHERASRSTEGRNVHHDVQPREPNTCL